jgi:hypothetical protein
MPKVSTQRTTLVRFSVAAGMGVVAFVLCALMSRYSAIVVWAFTFGCTVGVLFGAKTLWQMIICGLAVTAAFEIVCGPTLREFEKRARAPHRPAVDQVDTDTAKSERSGPARTRHHDPGNLLLPHNGVPRHLPHPGMSRYDCFAHAPIVGRLPDLRSAGTRGARSKNKESCPGRGLSSL